MVGGLRVQNVVKNSRGTAKKSLLRSTAPASPSRPAPLPPFIGPSGCGKSTLLRLIAGLIEADEGAILLDGEKISGTSYERGLVFQKSNVVSLAHYL